MEALQKEHEKVWKTSQSTKVIDQTQNIIDALQKARDQIAADPASSQVALAKLQNPVKTSFDSLNTSLKETNAGHSKYARALNKLFEGKNLPNDVYDALSSHPTLINRAIYLHLLREGLFDVAAIFHSEAHTRRKEAEVVAENMWMKPPTDHPLGLDKSLSEDMERQFATMYSILSEMKENHNLNPAIQWSRTHSRELEVRGSNLEFELCRLQYVNLFLSDSSDTYPNPGQLAALSYAQKEFKHFSTRYLREIQELLTAQAFASNLSESPFATRFSTTTAWSEIATSFTSAFTSLLSLSATSPLHLTTTAGAIALPTLTKLQSIITSKKTSWTTANELPVEIPLPPSYQFHSIFVCPVSKEQSTDANPPMMIPCGHVLAHESLSRLSKGARFKCPYCPGESHPTQAKKVFL
jgi:E3 ubiquitin-protein transferase RMND5